MPLSKPVDRNGTFYLKRKVPSRFRSIEDRSQVWVSLHTRNAAEAEVKQEGMVAAWEARLAGEDT